MWQITYVKIHASYMAQENILLTASESVNSDDDFRSGCRYTTNDHSPFQVSPDSNN